MVLMDCSLLLSIILGPATGPVNSPSAAVPRLREHPVLNGLIHFDPVGTPKHSVLNSFSFSQGSCLSELTAVQSAWQKLQEPWRGRGRMGKKVAHQRYLCFPIRGKQNNIKQPTSACYKKNNLPMTAVDITKQIHKLGCQQKLKDYLQHPAVESQAAAYQVCLKFWLWISFNLLTRLNHPDQAQTEKLEMTALLSILFPFFLSLVVGIGNYICN